jgi:predicted nucleotidyltransferase
MDKLKAVADISMQQLAEFCRRRGILRLSLFGSVLRDDFGQDSDVDVLVLLREDAGLSTFDFIEIRDELSAMFGREVDLLDEGGLRNPFRRREILRTRRVLYDAA